MALQGKSSIINFLKESLILPTANSKLFFPIIACSIAFNSIIFLLDACVLQPLTAKIRQDSVPSGTSPTIDLDILQADIKLLLKAIAACLAFIIAVSPLVSIIAYYATTAAYSGERQLTLRQLLSEAKGTCKGPIITQAVLYLLQFVFFFFAAAIAFAGVKLIMKANASWFVVFFWVVLCLAIFLFSFCLAMVSSMSIIVSVVETGCHGFAAIARAVRLMRGQEKLAFTIIVVSCLLLAVSTPFYSIAKNYGAKSVVIGLLSGLVYVVLSGLVQFFTYCEFTVYYFECKQSKEERVAYAKVLDTDDLELKVGV